MPASTKNTKRSRTIASKIFVSIARENNAQVQTLKPLLQELGSRVKQNPQDQEAITQWGNIHNQLVPKACIAIIFAEAALEAYIYDYGVRGSSASFMEKVDKLRSAEKWAVVPQLVKGKQFPIERQGYELLKKLVKARNDLVHFKSQENSQMLDPEVLATKAQEAIRTVDALVADMRLFYPDELGIMLNLTPCSETVHFAHRTQFPTCETGR